MPLSDAQLRTLKKGDAARKISDGGGLHVLVTPQGGKLWRLAYRYGGKQKLLALGAYPAVSLTQARSRREEAKRLLGAGLDPSAVAKADKARRKVSSADTFEALGKEFLAKVEKEGKADATLIKKRWLVRIANASIGKRPIAEISAAEILVPLRKVESDGNYETARRLRAVIGQVFRYAISTSRVSNDPTFGLRGALVTPRGGSQFLAAASTSWPSGRQDMFEVGTISRYKALKLATV